MDRQTSRKGMDEILSHEALVLNRYLDTVGVWTIGVGVTDAAGAEIQPSTFRGEITIEQGLRMFIDLLPQYERYVDILLRNAGVQHVEQHEYDALVSLSWNVGSILSVKGQTRGTRARITRGDIPGAIDLWRANRELWKRRDKEVNLARSGEYKAKTFIIMRAGEYGELLWKTARRRSIDTAFRSIGL